MNNYQPISTQVLSLDGLHSLELCDNACKQMKGIGGLDALNMFVEDCLSS